MTLLFLILTLFGTSLASKEYSLSASRHILQAPSSLPLYMGEVIKPGFSNVQKLQDPGQSIANLYYAVPTPQVKSFTILGSNSVLNLQENDVLYAMETSRMTGWLGVGRSPDGSMDNSEVAVAQFMDDGTTVQNVSSFYLGTTNYPSIKAYDSVVQISNGQVLFLSNPNRRLLIFTRKSDQGNAPIVYGQQQQYVYAYSQKNRLIQGKHSAALTTSFLIQAQNTQLQSTSSQNSTISGGSAVGQAAQSAGSSPSQDAQMKKLVRSHAVLNYLAYLVLFPLAVVLARNKGLISKSGESQSKKPSVWLLSHAVLNTIAAAFTISAVIIALALPFGSENHGLQGAHKVIGIILLALVCYQILLALLRPFKNMIGEDSIIWKVWGQAHRQNGRIILLLAIINVPLGILLASEGEYIGKWDWMAPYIVLVILWAGVFIILEVARPRALKSNNNKDQK